MAWEKRRTWSNARDREMQEARRRRKRREDARLYAAGAGLMIATFCLVFFWSTLTGWWNALALTGSLPSSSTEGAGNSFACEVASITDGDTLRCADGTQIRIHAIAARERDETCSPGHPCPDATAAAATAKLSELASGQTLVCRATGTSYKRVTAICRNEHDVEINCAMVESGTALIWPKFNAQNPICR
jgi:hypothetical protein